jgi:hypothetical protein
VAGAALPGEGTDEVVARMEGAVAWARAGKAEPLSASDANSATLQDSKLMRRRRFFTVIGYFSRSGGSAHCSP